MCTKSLVSYEYEWRHEIYSLGCVLWEVATSENLPSEVLHEGQCSNETRKQKLLSLIPSHCPAEFRQLIIDCWVYPTDKRPPAVELVKRITSLLEGEQPKLANQPDEKGRLRLTREIAGGDPETVATLINSNADVNLVDSHGWTPLFWAVQRQDTKGDFMAKLLVNAKANPVAIGPKQTLPDTVTAFLDTTRRV